MKIIVFQYNHRWIADCCDFSGTPPIGEGQTKNNAVGDLLYKLKDDPNYSNNCLPLEIVEIPNSDNIPLRGDIYKTQLGLKDG